jgi:hypothetical protein
MNLYKFSLKGRVITLKESLRPLKIPRKDSSRMTINEVLKIK